MRHLRREFGMATSRITRLCVMDCIHLWATEMPAITALEGAGYDGWYVIEQDAVLECEPATDRGPVEGQRESLRFLETI